MCTFKSNIERSDKNWGSVFDLKKIDNDNRQRTAWHQISSVDYVSSGAKNDQSLTLRDASIFHDRMSKQMQCHNTISKGWFFLTMTRIVSAANAMECSCDLIELNAEPCKNIFINSPLPPSLLPWRYFYQYIAFMNVIGIWNSDSVIRVINEHHYMSKTLNSSMQKTIIVMRCPYFDLFFFAS